MFWIFIIFGGFRTNVVEQFKENQNKQKLCKRFTLHYVSLCLVRIGNQKRSFDWSKRFLSSCTRHSQASRPGNSQLSFCSLSLHNISCGKVPLLLLQHFQYYWVDVEGSSYVTLGAIYQTLPFCSFFQKVPFDIDFIWKMKMKSSFFIWNIKKTCAARASLRSLPHPSHPPFFCNKTNKQTKQNYFFLI